mmetsp:Transcript_11522/g.19744  ORF Transcript_11522/g.19744 Transcript_11522/m.19744 type:complete len:253 (+) Transcript_11522:537-1295(+)
MRTSTKLNAIRTPSIVLRVRYQVRHRMSNADHAYGVRIHFAKHRAQRVNLLGFAERDHLSIHPSLRFDLFLHLLLDLSNLLRRHRLVVREIKSQLVCIHQRTTLVATFFQHTAKRIVEHMRHGMVGRDKRTPLIIHAKLHFRTHNNRFVNHLLGLPRNIFASNHADVKHVATKHLHINNIQPPFRTQRAYIHIHATRVRHLTSSFRVKARSIEHQTKGYRNTSSVGSQFGHQLLHTLDKANVGSAKDRTYLG